MTGCDPTADQEGGGWAGGLQRCLPSQNTWGLLHVRAELCPGPSQMSSSGSHHGQPWTGRFCSLSHSGNHRVPPAVKANPLCSSRPPEQHPVLPSPIGSSRGFRVVLGVSVFFLKIFKLLPKIQLPPRLSVSDQQIPPDYVEMKSLCLLSKNLLLLPPQGEERPSLRIMGLRRGLKERSCFVA